MNPVAAQAGPDRPGSDRRTRLMNFPPAGRPILACEVSKKPPICGLNIERVAEMQTPLRSKDLETPLRGVRTNIVQSIRAFRVQDLQDAATSMGHHFLYANLAHAQSKQDVLDLIAAQFTFPSHFGKNFDALYDCMTDPLHKSGPQPGFIVCSNRSRRQASSTRKRASSCSTSSATRRTTGAIARYRSGVSILFCSPFCIHQPSRTGERGYYRRQQHQRRSRGYRDQYRRRRREDAHRQARRCLADGAAHEQPFQCQLLAERRLNSVASP